MMQRAACMFVWLIDYALTCVHDKRTVKSILNRIIIKVHSGHSSLAMIYILLDRLMADVISVTIQSETLINLFSEEISETEPEYMIEYAPPQLTLYVCP